MQFHLICQKLAKFPGLNPYLSLEKRKKNFCVVFTGFMSWAREIRKFHVAAVMQRLLKKCDARAKLSFWLCYLRIFCRSRCRRNGRCLSSLL